MKILALDLATTTGYYTGDNKPKTITFDKKTRTVDYWTWLSSMVFDEGEALFDALVIENAILQKGHALEVFHDLKAVTRLVSQLAGIPMYGIAPNSIKKGFTGNGNATKDDMIKECLTRGIELPYRIMKAGPDKGKKRYSHDAADAVAIYDVFVEREGLND